MRRPPQRERQLQAVAWHNKADYGRIEGRIISRGSGSPMPKWYGSWLKFCRRMARNNERAHERNAS